MVNLVLYYVFYLLIIFSFIGYGIVFEKYFQIYEKKVENIFVYLYLGISFLLIFSFFYNILLLNHKIFNLFFLLAGIYPFIKQINKFKKQINIAIILSTVLFIGLIISKPHEDFFSYHYQYIAELSENILKIGLTNLDQKYTYSSIFSYLQSIFNLPYINLKTVHLPSYLLFVCTVGYLFIEIINKKSNKTNISIFVLLFIILKYKRLSEFGYDHIAHFLIIFIFLEFFYKKTILQNKAIIFFISIAILIKVTSIFFIPMLILLFRKQNLLYMKRNILNNLEFKDVAIFFPILIFVLNSFFSNGCLFYGLKQSCFNKKNVSWSSDYSKIQYEKNIAEKWAKDYFHSPGGEINYESKNFTEKRNWIPNWINVHFKVKVLKYLSISLVLLVFLKWFVFYKKTKRENFVEFVIISFTVILWFSFLPQLRFGSSFILLFSYYLISYVLNFGSKSRKKNFIIFFIIIIFYFNFSNVLRIKKEFERNDYYKFNNFPFFAIPNFAFKKIESENNVVYHRYIMKDGGKALSTDIEKKPYSDNDIFNLVKLGTKARFYKKYSMLYIINDE